MAATVSLADLPDELRELLEGWLVEFDQSWDEGRLAARVRELPADHPLRLAAVAEMIKIDQEHRWRRGDRVPLESYLRDYPDLGTPETVPADLVLAEYELRRELGDEPSLAEFEARFPRQAGDLGRHAGPVNPSTVVSGDAGTMSPPAAGG